MFALFFVRACKVALILFCFRIVTTAQTGGIGDPQTYHYAEGGVLALGLGFSPNDLADKKRPCLVFAERHLDPGPSKTTLTAIYLKNTNDLLYTANIDAKVEAAYLSAGGNAHLNFDTSNIFSDSTVDVVLKARTDYGRWGLKDSVVLTADANKLLTDPKKFVDVCGSRYVSMEQRASSANVLISLSSVSADIRDTLEADAQAHGSVGALSASASAKFSTEIKRGLKQHRVTFKIFADGGGGISSLSGLTNGLGGQDDPMQVLSAGLSKFLEGFTPDNPAVYMYTVSSMDHFGLDFHTLNPWTDKKEEQLRAIVNMYDSVSTEISNAENYQAHGVWYKALGKRESIIVTPTLPRLIRFKTELARAHKKCKDDETALECEVPEPHSVLMEQFLPPPPPTLDYVITPHPASIPPTPESPGYKAQPDNRTRYPTITGDLARSILSADRDAQQSLAKRQSPEADNFSVELYKKEWYPDTHQYVFVDEDGKEEAATYLANSSISGSWTKIPRNAPDQPYKHYQEDLLTKWLRQNEGDHSGTFYVDLKDLLGRKFRLPLFDVTWSATGGAITKIAYGYRYN